jgi:hypothetical protein
MSARLVPGPAIYTLDEFVARGKAGSCFFVGYQKRPLNYAFLQNWQLHCILNALAFGVRLAVRPE